MPGKINPSIPEMVNQVCFQVMGCDTTVAIASEHGQLELNVMMPVIAHNVLLSMQILTSTATVLTEKTVRGIEANEAMCAYWVERSAALATALMPHIGYAKAAELSKQSVKEGVLIREMVRRDALLPAEQVDDVLDLRKMTEIGVPGRGARDGRRRLTLAPWRAGAKLGIPWKRHPRLEELMPRPPAYRSVVATFAAALLPAAAAAQVAVGHTDDFQDGTTQGWRVNILGMGSSHPAPPANIASGGPAGAGDRFLQLTSFGGPNTESPNPGSRLSALNVFGAWAGDYRAAGIPALAMDVKNFGPSDLFLRLVFEDPTPTGPPQNFAMSADPVVVRAGADWQRVLFPLVGPGALAPLFGSDLDLLMTRVTLLRLVHSETLEYPPSPVVARLGVDNITATPEPATAGLVAGGLLLLVGATRVRRRG
jgi:hypothetical protein